MTVGQIMVAVGVGLIVAAALLAIIGSVVLHNRKKAILLSIQHEYR